MRILLVTVPDALSGPLRAKFGQNHEVTVFDGDPRDLSACQSHASHDVIVHGIPESGNSQAVLEHASSSVWNLLTTTSAKRYVLLSSMRLFDGYDDGWHITERWVPRPSTAIGHLAPYLAEIASREISRSRPIECRILRLDELVSADQWALGPIEPDWLHAEDAVAAIARAAVSDTLTRSPGRWQPFHIVRGDDSSRYPTAAAAREPFAFSPTYTGGKAPSSDRTPSMPKPPAPVTNLPEPERIVIFGAGGPLGAVTARLLQDDYMLRLTSRRPLAENAAAPPQSEGAPLPMPLQPPHEEQVVDITDPGAVDMAVKGMDTIINCGVVRHDPSAAFLVNTIGAYNVMRAAVTHGIRRMVHTGPVLTLAPHPAGYNDDANVGANVPPRPGDNLYFVSKLLGQEVVRIFAEAHGIASPTLLFSGFVDPEVAARQDTPPGPFTISWNDSGRAMVAATRLRDMATPFEIVHVMADNPLGRFDTSAMRHVLDWEPQDRLDHLWYRR